MLSFIIRRLLQSIAVLLVASFFVYILAAYSGDPLEEFRISTAKNKEQLIAARTQLLHLNVPVVLRYFVWLWGLIRGIWGQFDLGTALNAQPVTTELAVAVPVTLQLLLTSTILAIVIGITIGIASALRQYSAFDYTVTFVSFFLFSLPSFFIAVVLKAWLGIGFNDFLVHAVFPWWVILIIAVVMGVIWLGIIGGDWRRRLLVFLVAGAATAAALVVVNLTDWFNHPTLTIGTIAVFGVGAALGFTYLLSSFRNKRALYSSLTVAALGIALYYPFIGGLSYAVSSVWILIAFGVLAVASGAFIGWLWGGPDRGLSARIGALTALVSAGLTVVDRFMASWHGYVNSDIIAGRPISTIGASTPDLGQVTSSYWVFGLDTYTHLILPTISICLISIAGYSRYSRASLLDVGSQDYIRTARAKGLPERTVIVRHAFRNALIPITTLVAFDFGSLVGGAIITETIFQYNGVGYLLQRAIVNNNAPVIIAVVIFGVVTFVVLSVIVDILYAYLDPRIRLN